MRIKNSLTKTLSCIFRLGFPVFIVLVTQPVVLGADFGFSFGDLSGIVARIINILIFASTAALIVMIAYGVIKGSMSMGDPRGLEGAKSTWTYAVYGFLIVVFSFVIFSLVANTVGGTSGEYTGFFGKITEALDDLLKIGSETSSGGVN
jgi:hypothetical protein